MSERGILIILSAPSGCGKSTVVSELMNRRPNIKFSVSATTRPPRTGEIDGKDYFFVNRERFSEMVSQDLFLEHAEYAGNCYGTPMQPVEQSLAAGYDVLLDIDVQGAFQVKARVPEALMVFLMPPSQESLRQRLVSRGKDSPEVIERRLQAAAGECARAPEYDYRVVNDNLNNAVERFDEILTAEHEKRLHTNSNRD